MTIINHKYRFVFLKPSRVGGSSVQYALLRDFDRALVGVTGDPWLKDELKGLPYIPCKLHSHATYVEVLKKFPGVSEYDIVSIKRHPYERFTSAINFFGHWRKYPLSRAKESIFEKAYDEAIEALKHDDYLLDLGERVYYLDYKHLQHDYNLFCLKHGVSPRGLPQIKVSKTPLYFPEEYSEILQKELAREFAYHKWEV